MEPRDIHVVLHPNPRVSRTMRALLGRVPGIALIEPCSHRELVERMRDSDLILSDSGGIQEEAPALGVPLLVLRDKTERPEGLVTGNMRLVGTSTGGDRRRDPANPLRPGGPGGDVAARLSLWRRPSGRPDRRDRRPVAGP